MAFFFELFMICWDVNAIATGEETAKGLGVNVQAIRITGMLAVSLVTALADAFAIGRILYPDAFADIDPEQKCDEIYTYLVGKPVYAPMKKDYGAIGQPVPFIK